jgi:hypothetical protein
MSRQYGVSLQSQSMSLPLKPYCIYRSSKQILVWIRSHKFSLCAWSSQSGLSCMSVHRGVSTMQVNYRCHKLELMEILLIHILKLLYL